MTAGLEAIKQRIEQCLHEPERHRLTEGELRSILALVDDAGSKRQDLLYLQTASTSLSSQVNGMILIEDGEISDGPENPDDWPYQTVLDAIRDGWRVIFFPNLALMMDESRTYGLGCEFILEKWG